MTPRSLCFVLPLVLATFSLEAQQSRSELAVSFGRSDFGLIGEAPAAGLSYNRFWTDLVSTRFGAFAGSEERSSAGSGKFIGAVHASGEVHFLRESRVSPYAGAGVAFAFNNVDFADFSDNQMVIAPIFSAGIDVKVSPRFAVGVDAHYLRYSVEFDRDFDIAIDPLTVMGSLKYRY